MTVTIRMAICGVIKKRIIWIKKKLKNVWWSKEGRKKQLFTSVWTCAVINHMSIFALYSLFIRMSKIMYIHHLQRAVLTKYTNRFFFFNDLTFALFCTMRESRIPLREHTHTPQARGQCTDRFPDGVHRSDPRSGAVQTFCETRLRWMQ